MPDAKNDPLAALLAAPGAGSRSFPPTSRYHGLEVARLETDDGEVAYLRRRFVPQPESFAEIGVHRVEEGERPDHVAARHLGDAEQFWRLADAHRDLQPETLTEEVGRELRITLPEGIPNLGGEE